MLRKVAIAKTATKIAMARYGIGAPQSYSLSVPRGNMFEKPVAGITEKQRTAGAATQGARCARPWIESRSHHKCQHDSGSACDGAGSRSRSAVEDRRPA